MPIRFACPCGKVLRVADQAAGKKATCPQCKKTSIVPQSSLPPASQETADDDVPTRGDQAIWVGAGMMIAGAALGLLIFFTCKDKPSMPWWGILLAILAVLSLGGGFMSIWHTLQGEEMEGDAVRTYHCTSCGKKISLMAIPAQSGVRYSCPHCEASLVS